MNNSNTPKIVVGVGLVAVYAAMTLFVLRGGHDVVAQTSPSAAHEPIATESVDTLVSHEVPTPDANSSAVTPAPIQQVASTTIKAPQTTPLHAASETNQRAQEVQVTRVTETTPQARNEVTDESTASANAAAEESVNSSAEVPLSKDSQITADTREVDSTAVTTSN